MFYRDMSGSNRSTISELWWADLYREKRYLHCLEKHHITQHVSSSLFFTVGFFSWSSSQGIGPCRENFIWLIHHMEDMFFLTSTPFIYPVVPFSRKIKLNSYRSICNIFISVTIREHQFCMLPSCWGHTNEINWNYKLSSLKIHMSDLLIQC